MSPSDICSTAFISNHAVRVLTHLDALFSGEMLDHYKGKVNFVGEPFGSTSCLGFHQFDPLLASGSLEKIVTVCRGEAKGGPITGHRL